jgi:hypothetical protein
MASTQVSNCRWCGVPLWVITGDGQGNRWWTADDATSIYCTKAPRNATAAHAPHFPLALMSAEERQEAERRQRAREIAQDQAAGRSGKGEEWVWGTCVRCQADDLVKGPPGAEMCIYCDTLRGMPRTPLPVVVHDASAVPRGRPPILALAGGIMLVLSMLGAISPDLWVIGAGLIAISAISR